jgi:hypothetical protein
MAFMNKFSRAPSPPPAVARVLEILMTGMRDGKGLGDMSVVEDMKVLRCPCRMSLCICAVLRRFFSADCFISRTVPHNEACILGCAQCRQRLDPCPIVHLTLKFDGP